MRSRGRAFTLVELLLVLTVVGVLAAVAVPTLAPTLARARLDAERNALHHALHLARRESIKRNAYVALCKTADRLRCDESLPWHAGWMLFVDEDRRYPPQRGPGEAVLRHHRPAGRVTIDANRPAFVVRTVRRRTTNGSFVVCDPGGAAAGLALVVSYTGRPRMTSAAALGGRLGCPAD